MQHHDPSAHPSDLPGTDPSPWTWTLPDGGRSNDADALLRRWKALREAGAWQAEVLGCIGDDPITLLQRPAATEAAPRLLIAAGFHGEEPAGPWGLLRFIGGADEALLDRVHLTLLPLANPSGFRAGRRFNDWGENPNRGFGANAGGIAPSREGRVLMAQAARLREAGRDGVLSCHEDIQQTAFGYLYSLERAATPGPFSRTLLAANARHFPVHPDGLVDGCPIEGGIVFNRHDGSFEAWAMELGVARAACVETPGQADIATRIAAQADMAQAFVQFALGGTAP
jgi:predicted deacylase